MSKLALNQVLERNVRPVIWLTNDIDCVDPAYLRRFTYCMELKKPKDLMDQICDYIQVHYMEALTLNDLAEQVGMSNVNLSNLKTGKMKGIRFETLDAICKVLECQPGDLMEYRED